MAFKKAERRNVFIKAGVFGPSGSGKSYSGLLVATGMAKASGSRIALINTERNRGEIYADDFDYDMLELEPPFTPERFIGAIDDAIAAGYKVLVIDSSSHEWMGEGGILDQRTKMSGNDFAKWKTLTPRHDAFISKITFSPIHIIVTMRGKDEYVLEENEKGKMVPKKLGVGSQQRNGFEYEFHVAWNLNMDHYAEVAKPLKGVYENEVRRLTEADGVNLIKWATSGKGKTITEVAEEGSTAEAPAAETDPATVAAQDDLMDVLEKYGEQMNPKGREYAKGLLAAGSVEQMQEITEKIRGKYEEQKEAS